MSWLTRIKSNLLNKIPKKDLEVVEKTRLDRKIENKEIPKRIKVVKEKIKEKLPEEVEKQAIEKKTFFGLFKKKETPKVEKEPEKKIIWFQKLKAGLFKSSEKITQGVKKIFVNKKLDVQVLNDLEELLIMADLGPTAAEKLTAELANEKFDKNITTDEVRLFLA